MAGNKSGVLLLTIRRFTIAGRLARQRFVYGITVRLALKV